MSVWNEPSPSDFDRWRALVDDGLDPSQAARELGFAGSGRFRRANAERHAEVLDLWRAGGRRSAPDRESTGGPS